MKLLLTSDGIKNKSIEKAFLELLGKPFEKSNLVFVPTAANVVDEDKSWLVNDMRRFKDLGFAKFSICDIAAVPKKIWLPIFEKADVLVFGGGDVYYLLSWMKKSGLVKLFPKLLQKRVYVGISAGSMVTARVINLSTHGLLYYEQTGKLEKTKGLGFVDFELRPHLNSKFFPKVRLPHLQKLAKKMHTTFYALDDQSAIKVIGGKVTVISEREWEKFN